MSSASLKTGIWLALLIVINLSFGMVSDTEDTRLKCPVALGTSIVPILQMEKLNCSEIRYYFFSVPELVISENTL